MRLLRALAAFAKTHQLQIAAADIMKSLAFKVLALLAVVGVFCFSGVFTSNLKTSLPPTNQESKSRIEGNGAYNAAYIRAKAKSESEVKAKAKARKGNIRGLPTGDYMRMLREVTPLRTADVFLLGDIEMPSFTPLAAYGDVYDDPAAAKRVAAAWPNRGERGKDLKEREDELLNRLTWAYDAFSDLKMEQAVPIPGYNCSSSSQFYNQLAGLAEKVNGRLDSLAFMMKPGEQVFNREMQRWLQDMAKGAAVEPKLKSMSLSPDNGPSATMF